MVLKDTQDMIKKTEQ